MNPLTIGVHTSIHVHVPQQIGILPDLTVEADVIPTGASAESNGVCKVLGDVKSAPRLFK